MHPASGHLSVQESKNSPYINGVHAVLVAVIAVQREGISSGSLLLRLVPHFSADNTSSHRAIAEQGINTAHNKTRLRAASWRIVRIFQNSRVQSQ